MSEVKITPIIGRNIKAIMNERGITQAALCDMSGLSIKSVRNLLTRSEGPIVWKVLAVAQALEVSVESLCQSTRNPVVEFNLTNENPASAFYSASAGLKGVKPC